MQISDIKLNESNPRTISREKLEKLQKSIQDFPKMMSLRPIVVDNNGVILGGNMRYQALVALGYKQIPDSWVEVAEKLNEEEKKRFIIEDNVAFGEWDWQRLEEEWDREQLEEWGIDTFPEGVPEEEVQATEDDFDEEVDQVETICKRGDVWQLGRHRLMCGDSTNEADIAKLMGGRVADLIVTDPPYNVNYKSKTNGKKIKNDNLPEERFKEFLTDLFANADRVLKPGGAFYIWHADTIGNAFRQACIQVGWQVRQCLIWNKSHFVLGRQDYQWKHEPCLYGWKNGAGHYFVDKRNLQTVIEDSTSIDINKLKKEEMKEMLKKILSQPVSTSVIDEQVPLKNEEHPTMKPVRLIAHLISNSSRQGEIVLDMCGGSGTTMIASEQLERKAYIMELDEHYCDVIIARWEKLTGKKAKKCSIGKGNSLTI